MEPRSSSSASPTEDNRGRRAVRYLAVFVAGAFGIFAGCTVTTLSGAGRGIHVHPTKVHIDASEERNFALVSVDADLLGMEKSRHGVSVSGGHCDLQSVGTNAVTVPIGDLVEVDHRHPTKVHIVAAMAPQFLQKAQEVLKGKYNLRRAHDLRCSFDVHIDLFHTGLVIPHTISTLSHLGSSEDQPSEGQTKDQPSEGPHAKARDSSSRNKDKHAKASLDSEPREIVWPAVHDHIIYRQAHRLHVRVPTTNVLLRYLPEALSVEAGISLIDPFHNSTDLRVHTNSNVVYTKEPSEEAIWFTFPFRTDGRVHLASLGKAVSRSVSGDYSPLQPRGNRPLAECIAEKLDRKGPWEPTRLLELKVRNPKAPLTAFWGDHLTIGAARSMEDSAESTESLLHSLHRVHRALKANRARRLSGTDHGNNENINLTSTVEIMFNDMPIMKFGVQLLGPKPWKGTALVQVLDVGDYLNEVVGPDYTAQVVNLNDYTTQGKQAADYVMATGGVEIDEDKPMIRGNIKFMNYKAEASSMQRAEASSMTHVSQTEYQEDEFIQYASFEWDNSTKKIKASVLIAMADFQLRNETRRDYRNIQASQHSSWYPDLSKPAKAAEDAMAGFMSLFRKGTLHRRLAESSVTDIRKTWQHLKDLQRRLAVNNPLGSMVKDSYATFDKSKYKEDEESSMTIRVDAAMDWNENNDQKMSGAVNVSMEDMNVNLVATQKNTAKMEMDMAVDLLFDKYPASKITGAIKEGNTDVHNISFGVEFNFPDTTEGCELVPNVSFKCAEYDTTIHVGGYMVVDFSSHKDIPVTGEATMGPFACTKAKDTASWVFADQTYNTTADNFSWWGNYSEVTKYPMKDMCKKAIGDIMDGEVAPAEFGQTKIHKIATTLPNPFGSLFDFDAMSMKSPQMSEVKDKDTTSDVGMPLVSASTTNNGQTTNMIMKLLENPSSTKEMMTLTMSMPVDMDPIHRPMGMDVTFDMLPDQKRSDGIRGRLITSETATKKTVTLELGLGDTAKSVKFVGELDNDTSTYGVMTLFDLSVTGQVAFNLDLDDDGQLKSFVDGTFRNKALAPTSNFEGFDMLGAIRTDGSPLLTFDGLMEKGKYDDIFKMKVKVKDADDDILFDVAANANSTKRGKENQVEIIVNDQTKEIIHHVANASWVTDSSTGTDTYTADTTLFVEGKETIKVDSSFVNSATKGVAAMTLDVEKDRIFNLSADTSKSNSYFTGALQLGIKDVDSSDIPTITVGFSEGFIDRPNDPTHVPGCQMLMYDVSLAWWEDHERPPNKSHWNISHGSKMQKANGTDMICRMYHTVSVDERSRTVYNGVTTDKDYHVFDMEADMRFQYNWDNRDPTTTPIPNLATRATTDMTVKLDDIKGDVTDDKVKAVMAEAAGVEAEDVVVEEIKIQVEVEYTFAETVTESDAKKAIAATAGVPEANVSVTITPKRRLTNLSPSRPGRRLAGVDVKAVITTADSEKADEVTTKTTDTAKVVEKFQEVAQVTVAPPTIKVAPKKKVEVKVKIVSKTATPVQEPDSTKMTQIGSAFGGSAAVEEVVQQQAPNQPDQNLQGSASEASVLLAAFALIAPCLSLLGLALTD